MSPRFVVSAPRETLQPVSESWGRHLRAEGKSIHTITTYQKAVRSLASYLPANTAAADVTRRDLEGWMNWLRDDKKYRPATLAQLHRSVQQLFRWMKEEGDIERSPLDGISPPRIPDTPPPVLTHDQQRALLAACSGQDFTSRRNTAIIRVLQGTGIRRAELAGLRVSDVDMDREMITVTGKGGHTRNVSFGRRASQALDRYLRIRPGHPAATDPLLWLGERGGFTPYGVEQAVKKVALDAGLPWVSCHTFRHTWAAGALEQGMHEQDVSEIAGWKSPAMVTRYGRAVRNQRALANHRANNPGDLI